MPTMNGHMPTIPSSGAPLPEQEPLHPRSDALRPELLRQVAESFGADAERYDRSRPRYAEAMVDRIVAALPGPDVLDVGIGTGIAARQFRTAGCKVLGVEPDPRMADFARRGGFEVEVATFESWDPAGRDFDAVIAGQAWHWVDPAAGAARAARVLRPGGRLAAFWNVGQPPPRAREAFAAVYDRVVPDSLAARGYRRQWSAVEAYETPLTTASDGIRQSGAFGAPEQWLFEWEQVYTRETWLDQLPTQGDHTRFAPAELAEVLTGIGAAVDAMGGSFTMQYTAVVLTAARTSAAAS